MSDYDYYLMLMRQLRIWQKREQDLKTQRMKIEKELYDKCDSSMLISITRQINEEEKEV